MQSPPSFLKTVAYLRKSRADGEETVEEVLAKHERIVQDFALRTWNAALPEKQIFREVQSGETIASRPVMRTLISMIQQKETEAVLVVDLQRLSRGDLLDVGTLSQLFQYTGCKILTPTKTYDLKDEYDKRFFEMELMHGNDYLEYTKKIMGRGRERSVMDGNYIGSRRPYGYERVFVDKRPTLSVIPAEAEVVRLIFHLYAGPENLGPVLIADRLNSMGLHSQRMDHWTPQAVRNIVGNPVYIGLLRWNRRKEVKEFRDGKIVTTQPVAEDYILAEGRHEPIIDRETWDRAVEASKSRAHPSARHDRSTIVNPLSGLLVCSECGKAVSYKQCYDHKTKKPIPPIYMCTTKGCFTRGATYADTLRTLSDSLMETLSKLEFEAEHSSPTFDPAEQSRNVFREELADLTRQQERLYEFLERGTYDEATFLKRNAILREKIETAERNLKELSAKEKNAEEKEAFRSALHECIAALSDSSASAESVNILLKKIIRRIDYRRPKTTRFRRDSEPVALTVLFK